MAVFTPLSDAQVAELRFSGSGSGSTAIATPDDSNKA